jgi:hypothetical protein
MNRYRDTLVDAIRKKNSSSDHLHFVMDTSSMGQKANGAKNIANGLRRFH